MSRDVLCTEQNLPGVSEGKRDKTVTVNSATWTSTIGSKCFSDSNMGKEQIQLLVTRHVNRVTGYSNIVSYFHCLQSSPTRRYVHLTGNEICANVFLIISFVTACPRTEYDDPEKEVEV